MRHIAYIGIGSNVGDKARQCEQGISEIQKLDRHRLLARSSLYKTQPIGYTEQDWFINLVIKIETEMDAPALLSSLKEIESRLGRVETLRWGPRTIDLDILFFNDHQIQTDELTVPHPLIQDRQFVLVPLAEIDPNLTHPVLKKTVKELLERLKEDRGVERLPDASKS
jgi:2-amino-4-hydroxy-6-hydroxymethyldihydropteridine diphosphokinase